MSNELELDKQEYQDCCGVFTHELMEEFSYPNVQVITIFIPNFHTGKIKLRQLIVGNDWVATCNQADEQYGLWYTTIEQAQAVLNRPIVTEV